MKSATTKYMSKGWRARQAVSGCATINIYQSIASITRKVNRGSIGTDWKMVGSHIRSSVNNAKDELKAR